MKPKDVWYSDCIEHIRKQFLWWAYPVLIFWKLTQTVFVGFKSAASSLNLGC